MRFLISLLVEGRWTWWSPILLTESKFDRLEKMNYFRVIPEINRLALL